MIAVLLGGYWAWHTFGVKELPTLRQASLIKTEINIQDFDKEKCLVNCSLEITNIGKTPFIVDSYFILSNVVPVRSILNKGALDIQGYINGKFGKENPSLYLDDIKGIRARIPTVNKTYAAGEKNKMEHVAFLNRSDSDMIICVYYIYPHYRKNEPDYGKPIIQYEWRVKIQPDAMKVKDGIL